MRIGVPRRAGYGQAATMATLSRGPDTPCPLTAGDEIVTIPEPVRRGPTGLDQKWPNFAFSVKMERLHPGDIHGMPPSTIEYTGRKLRVQGSDLRVGAADRDRNLALGGGKHPHFARLGTKCWTVVDLQAGLGLPLMHHLVQQGVLDLAPVMPPDVSPTDTDFFGLPVLVHHQLTETALHPAGKPDG